MYTTYIHLFTYIYTTNPSASQSHSSKQTPNDQTQHIAFTPFARTNTLTFNPFTQQHSTITLPPKFRTQLPNFGPEACDGDGVTSAGSARRPSVQRSVKKAAVYENERRTELVRWRHTDV